MRGGPRGHITLTKMGEGGVQQNGKNPTAAALDPHEMGG